MLITKKSMISGTVRTKDIPITQRQYDHWILHGLLIQEAFPHLSADDREFLITGITAEEWATFADTDTE